MTEPGLTRRLRQQSHRSGLAVGISMALAIAVCLGGFTWLYVQLDPWVRDFAGYEPAPTATAREQASNNDDDDEENQDEEPTEEPADEPEPTSTPEPEDEGNGGGDIEEIDNGDFDPDFRITALEAVNMRSGAGRSFDIVTDLDPGTELEFLGDRQPAPDPDDVGLDWLHFETEDGQDGWIREIDVGET